MDNIRFAGPAHMTQIFSAAYIMLFNAIRNNRSIMVSKIYIGKTFQNLIWDTQFLYFFLNTQPALISLALISFYMPDHITCINYNI